jgi:hypothetical protein
MGRPVGRPIFLLLVALNTPVDAADLADLLHVTKRQPTSEAITAQG